MISQNSSVDAVAGSPPPGSPTFMPQRLAISVAGRKTMLKTVRIRSTSLNRCESTCSFVDSSASLTSL